MTDRSARVIKRGEYSAEDLRQLPGSARHQPVTVIPRRRVDDALRANDLVARAETRCRELLSAAERSAADLALIAEAKGRAQGAASVAALAVTLRTKQQRLLEENLDQVVALARLLAERVLGEELQLAPERVVALARQALNETRGAKQVGIACHPEDQEFLERSLDSLGAGALVRVEADASRARGDLKVVTEIGTLDAAIAPQLERLALRLREELEA